LLDAGAALSERDTWNRTPWLLSLHAGDLDKCKLLLASGASRDKTGHCGCTPLMYAIKNEHIDILRWLIEEGCHIEATDDFGNTPLIVASEQGSAAAVKFLLDHGARADTLRRGLDKAISVASTPQVVRILVAAGEDLNEVGTEMRRALVGLGNDRELLSARTNIGRAHTPDSEEPIPK